MDSSRGKKTTKCIENWTRRLITKFSAVTIQGTSIAVKCNKADATDVAEGVDAFILLEQRLIQIAGTKRRVNLNLRMMNRRRADMMTLGVRNTVRLASYYSE